MNQIKFNMSVKVTKVSATQLEAYRSYRSGELNVSAGQINCHMQLVDVGLRNDEVTGGFMFIVEYVPAIAKIKIRGDFTLKAEKQFLTGIIDGYKKQAPPPAQLIHALYNVCLTEAAILSKIINAPSPIPVPIPQPPLDNSYAV
ncbi:MAG: hypothetical protein NWF09_09630 [Candidatus Bathyarchaeota archaeon]|nr:hypothetical protein [Candidatus Bathyarchaeota archaeon]